MTYIRKSLSRREGGEQLSSSEKAAYDSQLISSLHKKLLNNYYVPISKEIDKHHTEHD